MRPLANVLRWLLLAGWVVGVPLSAAAQEALPDNQWVTPTAAAGAVFTALNPGLADLPGFNDSDLRFEPENLDL